MFDVKKRTGKSWQRLLKQSAVQRDVQKTVKEQDTVDSKSNTKKASGDSKVGNTTPPIGEKQKQISPDHHQEGSTRKEAGDKVTPAKNSDVEIVDVPSDSDVDSDEFRDIFDKRELDVVKAFSHMSDEAVILSDDESETSSCCIVLDQTEPVAGPSSKENVSSPIVLSNKDTSSEIPTPELPTGTTITRVIPRDRQTKLSDNKDIEVVDID